MQFQDESDTANQMERMRAININLKQMLLNAEEEIEVTLS